MPFEDIRIIGLNDVETKRSTRDPAFHQVVLDLSTEAPRAWTNEFNDRWARSAWHRRRKAYASGRRLSVECLLEELQPHITEFNRVIADTNQAYRVELEHQFRKAADTEAAKTAERDLILQAKASLRFD